MLRRAAAVAVVLVSFGCGARTELSLGDDAGTDGGAHRDAGSDGGRRSDAGGCAPGHTLCRAGCVDLRSDFSNCGACGLACGDSACVDGLCRIGGGTTCADGETDCGDGCTNLRRDRDNCGMCGHACDRGE